MRQILKSLSLKFMVIMIMPLLMTLHVASSVAGEYDNALNGVKGIDVVFDVSAENPKFANIVFWAVRDTYKNEAVNSLPEKPHVAVVFHGKIVKLLSSDRTGFDAKEHAEIDKFQATLKQMANEGVRLEVCLYAVKVLGVDPATILPEIDQVGNGFITIAGYQTQGYSVIRIP